ncbi:MAG: GLUG motif-containing protein [Christensenellales bacterium]
MRHVGGFVGWNKGMITDCFAEGNVDGGNTTGGFAGSNYGSIYDSHATGAVTAGYTAGGFVGSSGIGSELKNCYATGSVIAISPHSGAYFGGFAGSITGKAENCISTGTLTPGWSYNGGFAGYFEGTLASFNEDFMTLKHCFANCETSLGTTVKPLGSYLTGQDETATRRLPPSACPRQNRLQSSRRCWMPMPSSRPRPRR